MNPYVFTTSLKRLIALGATFALAAPLCAEREWTTHQAARLVIGQDSFTRQNPESSQSVIGAAGGVAVGGNRLFIADGNRLGATPVNNRVLIYNDLAGFLPDLETAPPQDETCPVCVGLADVVLGQEDFDTFDLETRQDGMYAPSAVATDGTVLAVADTNNNRVLLWLSIPTSSSTPADVVVGQSGFRASTPDTTRRKLRGPQGVWIDGGKLFVADTQNSRVLIWNSIPVENGEAADVVVGQPDFETRPEADLTLASFEPSRFRLLDPVSVTTSNGRMFVSDLGFDRVLIYNQIPTTNTPSADVVIGQADMVTAGFRDHDFDPETAQVRSSVLDMCEQIGPFDDDGSTTPDDDNFPDEIDRTDDTQADPEDLLRWPRRCEHTLNYPRFALSDGEKLFIADSGNDRILIYHEIPTENGAAADVVIGQPDFIALTDTVGPGSVRSPTSLAYDGLNLYVADPFVRRVLVFTPAEPLINSDGIRNGASFSVKAWGWVDYEDATDDDGQLINLTLSGREYEFRTEPEETGQSVRDKMIELINDDPDTLVSAKPALGLGDYAKGWIDFDGEVRAGELIRLTIGDNTYEYTTLDYDVPLGMVDRFNWIIDHAPDPLVVVDREPGDENMLLITAREAGEAGNSIGFSIEIPEGSPLTAQLSNTTDDEADGDVVEMLDGGTQPYRIRLTALADGRPGNGVSIVNTVGGSGIVGATSGSRLAGGSDARMIPNGAFSSIFGENLADETLYASLDGEGMLPTELGGVQVFVNGLAAPLYSVSPEQINFQVPWEVEGAGASTFVRRELPSGEVLVTVPRGNEIARAAPGIFAYAGEEPRRAVALHGQGRAQGTISIGQGSTTTDDDEVNDGATITVTINGGTYTYTTQEDDTLDLVRDKLIAVINAGDGDPDVVASASQEGFFSARATITLSGDADEDDVVTITVNGRDYSYTVTEEDVDDDADSITIIRNRLVNLINAGTGDREVTARRLEVIGSIQMQVIARSLGIEGNDITIDVSTTKGADVDLELDVEEGYLEGGQTPPVVLLTARAAGPEANETTYDAESDNTETVVATPRAETLCCGNVPYSVIDDSNPAIPGETIIVYASGLGFTAVKPQDQGIKTGQITPANAVTQDIQVPFIADDFVSSLAGDKTATVVYAGLAPGLVGVYQINLRLNENLPDDPATWLRIDQVLFYSNIVTIPVKNRKPVGPNDL